MIRAVAVDFDEVIHTYERGWADGSIYGSLVPGTVAALSALMSEYAVFVHTSRNVHQVARWIEQQSGYGIECVTRMTWWLPGWLPWGPGQKFWGVRNVLLVTNRKLPAVAYVDDRAVRFESWDQALQDLR